MFDGGNFLGTDLEVDFDYSDDTVIDSDVFGSGSKYFTKKYPGAMFVLVADNTGASRFSVIDEKLNNRLKATTELTEKDLAQFTVLSTKDILVISSKFSDQNQPQSTNS